MLLIATEVATALRAGRPVVALESTLVAHGMPWPRNLEVARALEAAVRAEGAVPATIAVRDGQLCVGLDAEALTDLARRGPTLRKVSRRDLPLVLASGEMGATTVAATMFAAARAGIRVFATGGIGGVHRGASQTFDISADLTELARTDVAVVCAGAKAILDLPLTLEYLETQGVPVIGYQTDEFPAFYTRRSGLRLEARADSPAQLARILHLKWAAGLAGGVVIANPIPAAAAADEGQITAAVEAALAAADTQGIAGKALTPFLLAEVARRTGGDSLEANVQLVLHNAALAAQVAGALAEIGAAE